MSDLRTELKALADRWGQMDEVGFTAASFILNSIIDANPDNTTTEWGVRWAGDDDVTEYQPSDKTSVVNAFTADIAWARRNHIKTPPKGELVARQVTSWEPQS